MKNFNSTFLLNKSKLIVLICIIILFIFTIPTIAVEKNPDSISKGIVIDTVLCKANPKFSYGLYLPTKYNEIKSWPIIYVFDPSANGRIEAELYQEAAEKYGYIVVCSNNSKNGPWSDNDVAVKYTMDDAEARFSFDKRRIYTSGYSGGSRLASLIALNTQKITGVIGYCAGFPPSTMYNSSQIKGFDYIGLIGKRDWNYFELLELEKKIQSKGLNTRLLISELNHELPSKESIMIAIEWMEFNAMKKNLCLKNDTIIQTLLKRYIKEISNYEKDGNLIEEARTINYLLNDFSGLMDISWYKAKLDSIIISKTYTSQKKKEENIHAIEQEMIEKYLATIHNIKKPEIYSDSIMNWWMGEVLRLKRMENHSDKDKQYLASRLLRNIFNIHMELGDNYYEKAQYPFAISSYKICCSAMPNIKYAYYLLACAQALNKDSYSTCKTLEKLIVLGFKNRKVFESEPAFSGIKNTKRFKSLINSIE